MSGHKFRINSSFNRSSQPQFNDRDKYADSEVDSDSGCSALDRHEKSLKTASTSSNGVKSERRFSHPIVYTHSNSSCNEKSTNRHDQQNISIQGKVAMMVQKFEKNPKERVFDRASNQRPRSRSFSAGTSKTTTTKLSNAVARGMRNVNIDQSKHAQVTEMVDKFNKLTTKATSLFGSTKSLTKSSPEPSPKPSPKYSHQPRSSLPMPRSKSSNNIFNTIVDEDEPEYCDLASVFKKGNSRTSKPQTPEIKPILINKDKIYHEDINDRIKLVVKQGGDINLRTRHLSYQNVWRQGENYSPPKTTNNSNYDSSLSILERAGRYPMPSDEFGDAQRNDYRNDNYRDDHRNNYRNDDYRNDHRNDYRNNHQNDCRNDDYRADHRNNYRNDRMLDNNAPKSKQEYSPDEYDNHPLKLEKKARPNRRRHFSGASYFEKNINEN